MSGNPQQAFEIERAIQKPPKNNYQTNGHNKKKSMNNKDDLHLNASPRR